MNTPKPSLLADDCQPLREAVIRGEVSMNARIRGQYPGTPLPENALPGLRTIGYWNAVGPQSWGLPMHRNEGIEICYLLNGETSFATDREEHLLRAGDITITRPWQRHCLGNPYIRPCRMFWIIIDVETEPGNELWHFPKWLGPDHESRLEMLRIFRANQRCQISDKTQSLKVVIEELCQTLDENGPLITAHLANAANHLLLGVVKLLDTSDPNNVVDDPHGFHHTLQGFFRGLEASMESAAEPWTVASMARACRVGVTYLTSSCKKLYNNTPSDHLIHIRLAHAARILIEEPEKQVTYIALMTGFNSSQYFATRFRRLFGMTPSFYRSKYSHRK